jgi:uncharacterized protein YjiS (DUF1127 family)
MTMLTNMQLAAVSSSRRSAKLLLARLTRLVNDWVAAAIVRRERKAAFFALHSLDDRDLKDVGLTRGDIHEALERAARLRKPPGRRL